MDDLAEYAPEEPLVSGTLARDAGYLQSKWVGERLCQIAAERTPLKTNVIRVGLLSGGVNGSWDPSHWVPSLVQSAREVGCLPEGDGVRIILFILGITLTISSIACILDTCTLCCCRDN